ncbi:hydrogenase small subunit [Campylobacter jejuni]|nr:oxidoreductase [Campylobacter jejuni]ECO1973992.1 hydrogenase small subunit [Campylobacter jejuni]EHC3424787.1 hydrogenase small subunit [Campylobacter jejuni]EIB1397332.1 hydrogenase small subunit [Campylobacter jejuni]EIT3184910.1 hydrogenase small subunit [Campylobacter jejuni]
MTKLSNEELKNILQNRISQIEISNSVDKKNINQETVKTLIKHLSLGNEIFPLAQQYFQIAPKIKVVWLHLAECTGCSESLLRTDMPGFDELIFDFISLNYHETVMSASGTKAEELLDDILDQDFVLAVEGGVAAIDTFFLTIGAHGESGYEILEKLAAKAKAIFAMGTCSSYGGIQAANPNPSKTCGISEVLAQKVVKIPGCPPSDVNIVANLVFFALFGMFPELDEQNRPVWAYGKCVHDMCERKAKFESGIFAEHFDDEAAKNGACLFKIGCKGPYTYNNCPKVKFNAKTSWPVAAGHGCIACSEKNFWDEFGNYEKPMANIFSYAKLCNEELKQEFFLEEQIKILKQIDFEFESNIKLILQNIAKNKLGALLVENYKKSFEKNYAFIEQNFDENPMPSKDFWKYLEMSFILVKGEFLKDKNDFLIAAKNYAFKHASPYDFKLNMNAEKPKLDVSKSFRMTLIYLCGGLDFEGIAYSILKAFEDNIVKISSLKAS